MNARGNIVDRFRGFEEIKDTINEVKYECLQLIVEAFIKDGHEWFSDDSRGRQEIFMRLAASLCELFCRFANGGTCQDIDQVLLHEITLFFVYSAALKC